MKLRSQLSLAGALVLLLPVVTWQYLIEMSDVLRSVGRQELQMHVSAIETVLQHAPDNSFLSHSNSSGRDVYAEYSSHPITLDGYPEDWSDLSQPEFRYRYSDNKSTAVTGSGATLAEVGVRYTITDSYLYLYFSVKDNKVVYHEPGKGRLSTGDRLELYLNENDDSVRRYILRVIAPGEFNALTTIYFDGKPQGAIHDNSVTGYWEHLHDGYAIEIKMPRPENGSAFGFSLIDIDDPANSTDEAWIGTVDPQIAKPSGQIQYRVEPLESYLNSVVPEASRLRVFNSDGWLMADINHLKNLPAESGVIDPRTSGFITALLYRFFNWTAKEGTISRDEMFSMHGPTRLASAADLNSNDEITGRYRTSGLIVNGLLKPFEDKGGFVLLETADESVSAIINSTMVRMFVAFVVLSVFLVLGLLAYAGWISGRVRKISQSTANALQRDGSIVQEIPGIQASDEIGELSRNITDMLGKISSYTDYLNQLASRLTHELRTPLAVVSTSLESMDEEKLDVHNREYLDRAASATGRLHGLIRSMTEATRLEQAVQSAERQEVDLLDWIQAVAPVYQGIYPERRIHVVVGDAEKAANVLGSVELLQQMLDKILSNAVDFSVKEAVIELSLQFRGNNAYLSVFNEGDALPESLAGTLFDPMVSHRKSSNNDEAHLGLGLHIVRLIAEFHQGSASAKNDAMRKGVVVTVWLPLNP